MKSRIQLTETPGTFQPLLRAILPVMFLLSLAVACGPAQTGPGESQPQEPRRGQYTIKPFPVIGNIYSVGLSNNTSFLITTPEGHILIDPTLEKAVPDIRKNIEQLGFNLSDIKIIIPTHAHADHVGGLAEFKELTGAKVMVMDRDAATVASGDPREDGTTRWKPVAIDHELTDGEQVRLGGVTLTAHLTAGHTRGCNSMSTVAEENGRNYNVVIICSIRLGTGVPLIGNQNYPTIAEDIASGLKKLKSLPADVWLVSHSYMFGMDEKLQRMEQGESNPFIDPEGYQAYVAEIETTFLEQLEKERAGGPPYDGRIPPRAICPEDGRTCY